MKMVNYKKYKYEDLWDKRGYELERIAGEIYRQQSSYTFDDIDYCMRKVAQREYLDLEECLEEEG